MELPTETPFLVTTKFEKYGTYTIMARSKEHAIKKFEDEITLRDLALGVWEADDEDDLIEEITTASGWCIKSIDYDIQLK